MYNIKRPTVKRSKNVVRCRIRFWDNRLMWPYVLSPGSAKAEIHTVSISCVHLNLCFLIKKNKDKKC